MSGAEADVVASYFSVCDAFDNRYEAVVIMTWLFLPSVLLLLLLLVVVQCE